MHSPEQLLAERTAFATGAAVAAALAVGSSSGGGGGGGGTETFGGSLIEGAAAVACGGGGLELDIFQNTSPPASNNIATAAQTYDLLPPVWGLEGKSLDIDIPSS